MIPLPISLNPPKGPVDLPPLAVGVPLPLPNNPLLPPVLGFLILGGLGANARNAKIALPAAISALIAPRIAG